MLPVIALVGRPNVGKSTLFNQLTRSRDALVADFAGLTRDRKYGEAFMHNRRFMVVDTGGLSGEEEGIDSAMAEQSLLAIQEADIVLFVVDCRAGLTPTDQSIGNYLRTQGKPVYVVANKIDGANHDIAVAPFYELGLGELFPTTATHGRGVKSMMAEVLDTLPEEKVEEEDEATGIKIAVVGRPNVGKSTLVNRLLGEDRVVVFDMPGTTRDSVYINYTRHDKPYTLIDTAGVRRRKNVSLTVEKFSIVKTLQAIDDANVVVLLMDASESIVDQDLHLMGQVIDSGRALVVALNKWDGLEEDHKAHIKRELDRRLQFIDFADVHFISALHGTNVGHLYESIERAYHSATSTLSTNRLTRILEDAVSVHQPPLVNGRRIKLRYAHAGGSNPPIVVVHGNQTDALPKHYKRYLEKTFRRVLDLHGTPIRFEFKSSDNPFAGRKSKLSPKDQQKQKRLIEKNGRGRNDRAKLGGRSQKSKSPKK
ncbi:ribosome biogenesis GTPase Der [Marinibactrum halimedae]|uniref:GTPase Der n=1 Tax=Marinibactrum halimedae TaxID=1444977 RepID=A0AA37T9L5_9GAMM|nr:ribosome biogenesis GTPase Der [Marinibactrum halimedae]MCD9458428.1 ribosome biogenesis GTPase Der [Marinibactrum halimedae]GLS26125.1 GTPase Der [Marinibactrum halimedae]